MNLGVARFGRTVARAIGQRALTPSRSLVHAARIVPTLQPVSSVSPFSPVPAVNLWSRPAPVSGTADTKQSTAEEYDPLEAEHTWRQQNHIWSNEELQHVMETADMKHKPRTVMDHMASVVMRTLYHSFNFITGYKADDPSPQAMEWRLIVLESFAGVPGFIAAGFRHFYSLRRLERDHGFIYTFLEEAENERMHLLVCMKMFEAGWATRALVITTQVVMTPGLMLVYAIQPKAVHRFVGYLEETACHTYSNVIRHCETPGTKLNKAWAHLDAPKVAKHYWKLEDDASWVTCLKHILADESHHRDVNHTIADLDGPNKSNPFVHKHQGDFDAAAKRHVKRILAEAKEAGDVSEEYNLVDSHLFSKRAQKSH